MKFLSNPAILGGRSPAIATFIIMVLLIALTACTGGSYGKLIPSQEAHNAFRSGPLPSDHAYYYYGREKRPYAIAGIQAQYQMVSKRWKPVATASGRPVIYRPYGKFGLGPSGKKIVGPAGEDVGIWFSIWPRTRVAFPGGNQVMLYPPDINGGSGIRATDMLN